MSKLDTELVDIPVGGGVHTKTAGAKKDKYVYKYTDYYRNAEGNPRNRAVMIGKVDTDTGKMRPNSGYYELFKVTPGIPNGSVWDYGYAYIALRCASDVGIQKCLISAFGHSAQDILTAAIYIIREGCVMDGIDDWLERTNARGLSRGLGSQEISRLFGSISATGTHAFFREWVAAAQTGDDVFYDVTSVSSYSRTMAGVEYGYNRDGEDLPQSNIGMFCDEKSRLPLYFNRYNGSLTDRANLSSVLENACAVGIGNIKLIVDGGFISEDCIRSLASHSKAFTIGIPAHLGVSADMLREFAGNVERNANKLTDSDVYVVSKELEFHGVSGRLLLFFDPLNHAQLCSEMLERIRSLERELAAFKRVPDGKLKRYAPYFKITRDASGKGFKYEVDDDKVDAARIYKGYFLIFTTDKNASADDILYFYRAKDADEKLFDQLKIDMNGNRFRTHNEDTTNGKAFVLFVALVIRSYMLRKLSKHIQERSTSLKKVINKLSNISIIASGETARFTKALTKEQKSILFAFNALHDIMDSVETCLR